jgi:phosphatidylserine synthase
LLSFLMVCTWRYRSFKDMQLQRPRSWLIAIAFGVLIYAIWAATGIALPAIFGLYVASGLVVRVAGSLRRRFKRAHPPAEQPLG